MPPRTRPRGSTCPPTRSRRPGTESKCCRCSCSARLDSWAEEDADEPDSQRHRARDPLRRPHLAPARAARGAPHHLAQGRLRAGRLRRLHRADRRRAPSLLPDAARGCRGRRGDDRRGPLGRRRPGTDPAGLLRQVRLAVRLLLAGHDDGLDGAPGATRRTPRASRSWRRSRATSAAARATSRSSTPSSPSRPEVPDEGRRRPAPPLRRDRARHGAHEVRGRSVGPGHARLQGPALAAPQRAHRQHRHVEGRGASRRVRRGDLQGHAEEHRRPPRGARRPRRRAVPGRGRGPLQGPADRRRGGDRRGHRARGARADRGQVRGARAVPRHPQGVRSRRSPR